MNDTDIIAAIAPDAVSLMDKAIAEIKRLRQENATLTAERDEARQQVRDIIQRKEAQMLSIIEEGNGVLSIIEEGNGVARVLDCYKEDCK